MKLVVDVETNSLDNPTQIWVVVVYDIDNDCFHTFRNVTTDFLEQAKLLSLLNKATILIGHNLLGFDYPVLNSLIGYHKEDIDKQSIDTLIVSRLVDYSRKQGHSLDSYGEEFNLPKLDYPSFTQFSEDMVTYCTRDVEICTKIYFKYLDYILDPRRKFSLVIEHCFQLIINELCSNGFSFNYEQGNKLLQEVLSKLSILDKDILEAFPDKLKLVREISPVVTKSGTLHKKDFRWVKDGDLSDFNGGPFCLCKWEKFNPSSHKQLIEVLHDAGWRPKDKTKTHIQAERDLRRLENTKFVSPQVDLEKSLLYNKLIQLRKYGYKINENNLGTLPEDAPAPARNLAQRILLESRRRTLKEWLGLARKTVDEFYRIHGNFYGIGAWTHRMAHQSPNTANIPTPRRLYGREMRELWQAPEGRTLLGVDAEGIQLRIFAHYINDPDFTRSLIEGKKEDKTDPHSLNQFVLGPVCKDRDTAKRFIYALLLGAGLGMLAEILDCSKEEAEQGLQRMLNRYPGFALLKNTIIPEDAKRGWFEGIDGRVVIIPGETDRDRQHLVMSGYLQNGEAVVMKLACILWHTYLKNNKAKYGYPIIVNFVHDEWQTELANKLKLALEIANIQSYCLWLAGEALNLNCPMAGSFWNDKSKEYTIGQNWYLTH